MKLAHGWSFGMLLLVCACNRSESQYAISACGVRSGHEPIADCEVEFIFTNVHKTPVYVYIDADVGEVRPARITWEGVVESGARELRLDVLESGPLSAGAIRQVNPGEAVLLRSRVGPVKVGDSVGASFEYALARDDFVGNRAALVRSPTVNFKLTSRNSGLSRRTNGEKNER